MVISVWWNEVEISLLEWRQYSFTFLFSVTNHINASFCTLVTGALVCLPCCSRVSTWQLHIFRSTQHGNFPCKRDRPKGWATGQGAMWTLQTHQAWTRLEGGEGFCTYRTTENLVKVRGAGTSWYSESTSVRQAVESTICGLSTIPHRQRYAAAPLLIIKYWCLLYICWHREATFFLNGLGDAWMNMTLTSWQQITAISSHTCFPSALQTADWTVSTQQRTHHVTISKTGSK